VNKIPPKLVTYSTAFPSVLVSDAEKQTKEYGYLIGSSICSEWFSKRSGSCRYYDQWIDFHKLRLYARGEQSTAKYKTLFSTDGDLSHLNIDWTPVPTIPKFVDIVVNGMQDRLYKIRTEAVDIMSGEKRNSFQQEVENNMYSKDILKVAKEKFGVNAYSMPEEDVPNSPSEVSLYMQLNFKPGIEIAEQMAIKTVMEQNRYESTIKPRFDYDITVLGVGMAKHEFLPNSGISLSYVDPANVVYSYTESPTFDDVFYWGEVKATPITELYKIKPDISKEELEEISAISGMWGDEYTSMRGYRDDLFQKDVVNLLYYNYKTTKKFVHKKKKLANGLERVIAKNDSFTPPPNEYFETIERTIDVWYEGIMILGSSMVLKWELSKNMVRPDSSSQYALPNYIACAPRMYKGRIESLTRRMIPFADNIQMTHLKLQQVVSKLVPDGVYIDADGLNEIDLGNGGTYSPQDALKLYFETGSVIGRSFTQSGEYNHARIPVQELNKNSGQSKIQALVGMYNQSLSMLRDVTGLNEARDGSDPDPNALVGVQKLAAANSNTATRHILQGSMFITKRMAEAISLRIADLLEYSDFREEFISQVGKYNVATLEDIKNLYLHDFGIFIDVLPDAEEKAKLQGYIQMALSKGDISLDDAIDIENISDLTLANELLKKKKKDREAKTMANEQAKMQMQTQSNVESANASAQSKMQIIEAEGQIKMSIINAQSEADMKRLTHEAGLKAQLMEKEFGYNVQLDGMANQLVDKRDKLKEDAKDNRTKLQATQQSQLIDQRQKGASPINFESNNDSLDGLDLGEFSPK